jgi:hypothetical protein
MGERREQQPPVKLFFALMAGDAEILEQCERDLACLYGEMDLRSEVFSFDPFTDYYAKEFGTGLVKRIVAADGLVAAEDLMAIKVRTNEMEREFATRTGAAAREHDGPRRVVNIDPGYLNLSKIVLASTKDHWHRLYVGRGIFEEITLSYRRKEASFRAMPWTYPDYQAPERIAFFLRLRERYHDQQSRVSG